MSNRGRPRKKYPPGKEPVFVTVRITREAKDLIPKNVSVSKAFEEWIYTTFGNPRKLKYDELLKMKEELIKEIEEFKKHQQIELETELEPKMNKLKYIENQLKEMEDLKQKEMDGLNFAVFVLKKAIQNANKSNQKLWKEQFFNELGIEFNYDLFRTDLFKEYGKILELSNEEMIQRYNIKFTDNKVSNKEAYQKYYSEYKNSVKSDNSEIKESESIIKNNIKENKIETINTTNNLPVSSNVNEIQEVKNEIKESESNIENIDISNETIQENERGQVNFTSTGEQIQQENKESKGEYIPSEELIKQEVKQRPKIGKFTKFQTPNEIYEDLMIQGIIEKNTDNSDMKWEPTLTHHIILIKIRKKWDELTENQQKYLKNNYDIISFNPIEFSAYVENEGELK